MLFCHFRMAAGFGQRTGDGIVGGDEALCLNQITITDIPMGEGARPERQGCLRQQHNPARHL